MRKLYVIGGLLLAATPCVQAQEAEPDTRPGFFITSTPLDGGNLGGLAGADAHCAALASAAGLPARSWRAYLSTSSEHARDRIGNGPWNNVKGELVARHLDDLHYSNVHFTKQNALNEKGQVVNGRGDTPNQHDILTGSNADGTHSGKTCNEWTSNNADYTASVGHFDRSGGGANPESWNASHESRGCSLENLQASGGNGFFYCFAAD
jgi:hypothetical protein